MPDQITKTTSDSLREQNESKIQETPLIRSLHRATRTHHTQLNQLILSRLPLCLPPHTSQPDLYARGLLHFAPIYSAFEAAWQLLADYEPTAELPLETAVVLSSLIHLHMPSLSRTERLRQDLSLLSRQPRELVDVRMRHPDGRRARDFVRHIKEVACRKPHALIAYSWVMYMALFNGGRWIREQLAAARDVTWALDEDAIELAAGSSEGMERREAGLSFWYFEGTEDGDDIKAEFKARLIDVGTMLDSTYRADVVEEANEIFERCAGLVEEIDQMVARQTPNDPEVNAHTIRMADIKRLRRASAIHCILGWFLHFGIFRVLVVFLAWMLVTIKVPFTVVRHVNDDHSTILEEITD